MIILKKINSIKIISLIDKILPSKIGRGCLLGGIGENGRMVDCTTSRFNLSVDNCSNIC